MTETRRAEMAVSDDVSGLLAISQEGGQPAHPAELTHGLDREAGGRPVGEAVS
jgi:hypothetical protein